MSTLFQPTALVGAIAIAMGSTSLQANDTTTSSEFVNTKLNTLVVTATRSEQNIKNVPVRITVIDQAILEKNPLLNVSDMIIFFQCLLMHIILLVQVL